MNHVAPTLVEIGAEPIPPERIETMLRFDIAKPLASGPNLQGAPASSQRPAWRVSTRWWARSNDRAQNIEEQAKTLIQVAAEELMAAKERIRTVEARLHAAEQRAIAAEARASEAEDWLRRIHHAIVAHLGTDKAETPHLS